MCTGFTYVTSGSGIQTAYTWVPDTASVWPQLPNPGNEVRGHGFFLECMITAGDSSVSEPRIAMRHIRGYLSWEEGLTLRGQSVIQGESFLDLTFSVSGGNVLIRVDPPDSATWYIHGLLTGTYQILRRP